VGRDCPECGKELVYRQGRYGRFISCSGYPSCKYLESLQAVKSTGVTCPQCQSGELVEKRSRYGKIFYSCNTYPKCNYAVWGEPVARACPRCTWPVLYKKSTKRRGDELICPQADCAFHFPEAAEPAEIQELLQTYQPPEPKEESEKPAKSAKTTARRGKAAPKKAAPKAASSRKKSTVAKV
jgi:DNA topoisomerase-1